MYYEVIPVRRLGGDGILTYKSSDSLLPGQIVEVPLGRTKSVAIVSKKVAQPDFACKEILRIIYSKPLPSHLVLAARFISEYYKAPLSSAISVIIPNGVEVKRRKTEQMFGNLAKTEQLKGEAKILLNEAQKKALGALQKAPEATKLLCGVTGSGKTNIFQGFWQVCNRRYLYG